MLSNFVLFLILMSFIEMIISQEHRSIARFIGFALCAVHEALKDANWLPSEQEQKERTVSILSMQIKCDLMCKVFPYFFCNLSFLT